MKKHFQSLYKYNHWCNQQMIDLIAKNPTAYTEKAKTLIGHTFNTHHIWTCRLKRVDRVHGVWDTFEIEYLKPYDQENFDASMYVLDRFDYEFLLKYVNTINETHTNRVKDILYHIVNHSTYHRGQLMTELKAHGVVPIPLDFTYYKEL